MECKQWDPYPTPFFLAGRTFFLSLLQKPRGGLVVEKGRAIGIITRHDVIEKSKRIKGMKSNSPRYSIPSFIALKGFVHLW